MKVEKMLANRKMLANSEKGKRKNEKNEFNLKKNQICFFFIDEFINY